MRKYKKWKILIKIKKNSLNNCKKKRNILKYFVSNSKKKWDNKKILIKKWLKKS